MSDLKIRLFLVSITIFLSLVSCEEIYTIYDIQDRQPKKDCPFRKLKNGITLPTRDSYASGTMVQYVCNIGYQLEGIASTATCNDGEWDRPLPKCDGIQDRQPEKDCPFRKLENGMTEPARPASGSYASGTTVRYACNIGYDLDGIASIARCNDGEWSLPLPICEVRFVPTTTPLTIKCKPLKLDNGVVRPPNPPYNAGDSVAFRCNEGYERKGTSISICLDDATWALPPPVCEAKEKKPKVCVKRILDNGRSDPDKFIYQSRDVVLYKCNPGYVLNGKAAAACFEGEWTAKMPVCKEKPKKTCPPPPFPHGTVFPAKKRYGDLELIRYDCEIGYTLKGEGTAACFDGKWTSSYPRCEDSHQFPETVVYCEPPSIEHGSYTPEQEQYTIGSVITLICEDGYFRNGHRSATCQENGEWTELLTCGSGCKEPIIVNGFYNTQSIKDGQYFPQDSIIIIQCNQDYIIDGKSELQCGANNQWDAQLPTCKKLIITITENGCLPPEYSDVTYSPKLPAHRNVYSVGDQITLVCKGGKIIAGSKIAECLSSGQWSGEPMCASKCRRPEIANGRIDKFGEFFNRNTLIRVICNEGYLAVGQRTAKCQYKGTWSARLRCTNGCYQPKITGLKGYPIPIGGGNVYEFGKRVNFRCNAGFSFASKSVECRGKNQWDKTLPSCKLISDVSSRSGCRRPELTEGLILKNQRQAVYPYKTQFEFQCAKGFNMIGSAVSICRKHLHGLLGGLDPKPPRCDRVKCGSPGKPQNGRFRDGDKGSYLFEDTVYFECNDRHIMSGNDHITCQADGQFNGIPPRCQPPSCRVECVYVDGRECQCDATCRIRGDCCGDFEQHCRKLFY